MCTMYTSNLEEDRAMREAGLKAVRAHRQSHQEDDIEKMRSLKKEKELELEAEKKAN